MSEHQPKVFSSMIFSARKGWVDNIDFVRLQRSRLGLTWGVGILFALYYFFLSLHSAQAFQVQATAPQAGNKCVRWSKQPTAIQIHLDGAPNVKDGSDVRAIREALHVWSAPSCNNLVFSIELTNNTSFAGRRKDPKNQFSPFTRDGKSVIRFETKAWEWSEQELARNATYFDPQTGKIKEADLLFNAVHWKWSATQAPSTIDIKTVAIARIGFMIGLWFSEVPGAMLHPSTDLMRVRHYLSPDDMKGSCFLYPTSGWKAPPPPKPQENPTAYEPARREAPPIQELPSTFDLGSSALPDRKGNPQPEVTGTMDTQKVLDEGGGGGCKCSQADTTPWMAMLFFFLFSLLLLMRFRHDHS